MRPTVSTATWPLLTGEPVDEAGRGAVRGTETLDLFGEREQIALGPFAPAGAGQDPRRRHAQGDRPEQQPLHLGGGDPAAAHAERPEHLVELLDGTGPAPALALVGPAAEQAAEALGERVAQGPAGERDAQVGLALGVVEREQVPLGADEVVAPGGRAGDVGERVGRVVVERAGPLVGRERAAGPAQVQAEPGQAGVLLGDGDNERLAVGVRAERPPDLGQPVPRGHHGLGERQVTGDLVDGQFGHGVAVLVGRTVGAGDRFVAALAALGRWRGRRARRLPDRGRARARGRRRAGRRGGSRALRRAAREQPEEG
jgi:hypothetical protein